MKKTISNLLLLLKLTLKLLKNWYITSYREAARFLYWNKIFIGFQQTFRRFLRKKVIVLYNRLCLQSIVLLYNRLCFSGLRTDGRMAITLHLDLGLTSNLRPRDRNSEIYIFYFWIYLPNLKSSMSKMAISQLLLLFTSLESPIMRWMLSMTCKIV